MTDEQSRDAFEAWATRQAIEHNYEYMSYLLTRHPETGDYNTTWVDSAWMGWQASREALVIELPPIWEESPNTALGQACAQIRTADIQAIKAAGLKVVNQ